MQADTKRNAQAAVQSVLGEIAAERDGESALQIVLNAFMGVTGASGIGVVWDAPATTYKTVGDLQQWTDDAASLLGWLEQLPGGLTLTPAFTDNTHVGAASWWVYRQERVLVCVWFGNVGADYNSETVEMFINLIILTCDRVRLWQSNERDHVLMRSVLNSIVDPLIILSDQQSLIMMNTAAESLFGLSSDEAYGKPLSDVVGDDELLAILAAQPAKHDVMRPPEWTVWVNDIEYTYLPLMSSVVMPDAVEGLILALRDVSRFKRLNRNQREFMRIVSHDLRSPLTAMQGFADMIRMGMVGDVTEKQVYFIDKILAGVTQMTSIVDNIQDAGRFDPETGFYEMQRSQVDVSDIVSRVIQNQIVPAEKQDLTLEVIVDDSVPIIYADENMLMRAITNLVDNAVKYTPNERSVWVEVTRDSDNLIVNVKDDGYGISEDDQKRLFQRHVRIARKEHVRVKGTGLGLFIVRAVAQAHNGEARVKSQLGEGTTFSLVIPLSGDNIEAPLT